MTDNSEPPPGQLTGVFFALFCVLPVAIVLYVFYGEEVRTRLENDLFDIRTRLKPQIADTSRLSVVTISQNDIAFLEQQNAQTPGYHSLTRLIGHVMASEPEAVALILPHHDLSYESAEFADFIRILGRYPNLYFGSFDLNFKEPTDSLVPDALLRYPDQEFGAGTVRLYRREVIRNLPLMSYRDDKLVFQLTNQLAMDVLTGQQKIRLKRLNHEQLWEHKQDVEARDHWDAPPLPQMSLNYIRPHLFLSVSASGLVRRERDPRLTGRIVLIGYTAYRKRTYEHRDGTYVNTPWEWDGNAEVFGSPLVYVMANQLQNLLHGSWLREAPFWVNLVQTVLVSVVAFIIWRLVPFLAVLTFCLIQGCLIYCHGLLFAFFDLHIPLADTVLFSVLSTIAGAFLRAHSNSQMLARSELKALSKKKLAMIQSRFLNRFSFELYECNHLIGEILERNADQMNESATMQQFFQKTVGSCEELRDYLSGIKQYATLTGGDARKVRSSRVDVDILLERILKQFESKLEENKINLKKELESGLSCWTDELFLEPVLFNLISNAIKYSRKGGRVLLKSRINQEEKAEIIVEDEGPGIAKEHHSKIFEKFYRVKNDDVYKVKGNGLGLYLCRYFSEKIAAQILVESEPGKGAKFTLTVESFNG